LFVGCCVSLKRTTLLIYFLIISFGLLFFVVLERVGKLVCVIKFVRWVLWQFEGIECIDLWSGLFGTRWDGYLFVGCCGSCKVTTLLRYRNVLERVGKQVCVI